MSGGVCSLNEASYLRNAVFIRSKSSWLFIPLPHSVGARSRIESIRGDASGDGGGDLGNGGRPGPFGLQWTQQKSCGKSADVWVGVCVILVAFREVAVLIYLEQLSCASGSGSGASCCRQLIN